MSNTQKEGTIGISSFKKTDGFVGQHIRQIGTLGRLVQIRDIPDRRLVFRLTKWKVVGPRLACSIHSAHPTKTMLRWKIRIGLAEMPFA